VYHIASIGGDGIGPEIIMEGKKVLDAVSDKYNFSIKWTDYDIGAERYLKDGILLDEDDYKSLGRKDAIYFGAIGDDRVPPGILEKGILLSMRFYFDQFVNLRPIKLLKGVETPLSGKGPEDIDFVVVRENTEDFYVGIGSLFSKKEKKILEVKRELYNIKFSLDIESDSDEIAYQIGVISREGSKRVIDYAFEKAEKRKKKLTSVDKANVLSDIYGLWRKVFLEEAQKYPGVTHEFTFVDAITMWFVKNPEWFDVVVTPNMFGDIITDLGAMIQGGLGLAPGGNINPCGVSMFEPIHGSAPKYRGLGVANPCATIWAGALMLETLGEVKASEAVVKAIERAIDKKVMTKDMGGSSSTREVGDFIAKSLY